MLTKKDKRERELEEVRRIAEEKTDIIVERIEREAKKQVSERMAKNRKEQTNKQDKKMSKPRKNFFKKYLNFLGGE